jgi:hypothetical protein
MTNNFSTLKLKHKTEKIILIRFNPARQVIDDLALDSGTTYTMTFTYPISGVKVDGIAYDLNNDSALSEGEYSYSESTGLFTIYLSDAVANLTAVIIYYYLFYTNGQNRQAHEDPENTATTLRNWEGRLIGYPEFETTQEDVIDNVLTIGNTSINLINNDNDFQNYLTDNDSFCFKQVRMWQCLNKIENIQKFYFGFVSTIKTSNTVSISIDNAFSALTKQCFSNETSIKSVFNITDYPNVNPNFLDKPIYNILSLVSKTIGNSLFNAYDINANSLQLIYSLEDGYQLVNIDYDEKAVGNNLVWAACKASTSDSNLSEVADDVVDISSAGRWFETTVSDSNYYRPGDNITVNGNGGFYVIAIPSATKIIIADFGTSSPLADDDVIVRPVIPFVQINNPNDSTNFYNLIYGEHYTITTDSNGVYNINLQSAAIESDFSFGGVWPECKIIYRCYNHDSLTHGTVLKNIVEAVGLEVDSDSVTAANLTNIKTNFSIPYFGETSFKKVNEVLQDLLTSTFGFLYLTNNFKIGYKLFSAISASNEISDTEILENTITQTIKYSDICNELFFENIHGEIIYYYGNFSTPPTTYEEINTTISTKISDTEAIYLHEVEKSKTINFIVQSMALSKDNILAVLKNRRLIIELITKGINFSSIVGDEFTINSSKLNKDIKILSINKSASQTTIRGVDLLGL